MTSHSFQVTVVEPVEPLDQERAGRLIALLAIGLERLFSESPDNNVDFVADLSVNTPDDVMTTETVA